MQEKEIRYQNKKLFYRTIGEGPVVMLLHGFGEDGTIWRPPQTPPKKGLSITQTYLLEESSLNNNFKLVIPDLPGSDKSEMIDDMSIEGLAEAMKTILFIENNYDYDISEVSEWGTPLPGELEGAVLLGHSMGGYITLAFTEKYPELLSGFGLFHSTAYADTEQKKETRKKGIEFISKHGAYEFLKTSIPNLYAPATKEQKPELIEQHLNAVHNFIPDALVKYYEAMIQRPDRTNVLKEAKVPVLFIFGRNDTAVPIEDGLQQCHLPENSYIHILEESGHQGMVEETERSNNILLHYLKNIAKIN